MQKKHVIITIIIVLIIGGGSFYGGLKYEQAQMTTIATAARARFAGGARTAGGVTMGQVLSNDGTSITIQTPDGGSKIIFVSDSTQVTRTTASSISDITTGKQVVISGTTNVDGSITAQSVQIRPTIAN